MLPFYWAGPGAAAGKSMFDLGVKLWETAVASNEVIGRRMAIIDAARANPLGADHDELALMVTEKVAAFAEAGQRLAGATIAAQAELAGQMGRFAALMLSGGGTAGQRQALQRSGARTASRALAASAEAIAPIHKAATGNARRLKGASGRRRRKGA